MANMLRKKCSGRFGCCDACASGTMPHLKPGPRERHNARAIEKRQWQKESNEQE